MAEHIKIGPIAPRIQYTADGAATAYQFPFPIFAAADLRVWLDGTAQTTGFAVTGAGEDAGGTCTFETAPAAGVTVTLARVLDIERTSDFQRGGDLRANTLNDELDYQTAAQQQLEDGLDRTLRIAAFDRAGTLDAIPGVDARVGTLLGFDLNGQPRVWSVNEFIETGVSGVENWGWFDAELEATEDWGWFDGSLAP